MRPWKILIIRGGKILKGNPGLVHKPNSHTTINGIFIVHIEVYKVLIGEAEDLVMETTIDPFKN